MIRVVVLEPDRGLRDMVRAHLSSEGDRLHVASTLEEAMRGHASAEMVVVRTGLDPDVAAAYPCAFELEAQVPRRRLLVLAGPGVPAGRAAGLYLQELDRILAARSLPPAASVPQPPAEVAPDFPFDAYEPLHCWGRLAAASILRVRERITARKGFVLQVDDAHPEAPAVARELYRAFGARGPYGAVLRHEYTALHSFIHVQALPLEPQVAAPVASEAKLAMAS